MPVDPLPMVTRRAVLVGVSTLAFAATLNARCATAQSLTIEEARAIAKEAYIYGFPLVDTYRIQYSYFVDQSNPEFKAPWNTLVNNARVYTPDDKAIQTPNSDTPYSYVGADLRAEPLVFTVPAVDEGRYYSLQFIDMYTFNFAYVGSRATGNKAGRYLLAGPGWKSETPPDINRGDPLRDRIRLHSVSHPAFRAGRHRERQDAPGWLQGRAAVGFSRPAEADAVAGNRFPEAARREGRADIARFLQ